MNPRNVEEVLMDFKGRRGGIIKALTKDVDEFYKRCDPSHPSLCLYGLPNQRWEVNPSPSSPPASELPEPRSGINIVRDATSKEEWLSMVALHSDAWLHAIASYFSGKYKFVQADRNRLFKKISDMSTISEMIMGGTTKKRAKANYGTLPDEMLVEVLSRLPVKDLLAYKFVCTKWRSIINDPDFVSTHLGRYKGNTAKNKLLVVMEGLYTWQNKDRVLVRCSDTFRKVKQLEKLDQMDTCHVLSYVNGLALVTNGVYSFDRDVIHWYHYGNSSKLREIILWNPSINKSIKVPRPEGIISDLDLGLGFDASKNDYKLVLLVYPPTHFPTFDYVSNNQGGLVPGLVQVYTLSTNSWITKPNVHPPLRCLVGSQVFVSGTIHWMALGKGVVVDGSLSIINKDRMYIFRFEVVDEVFNDLDLPIGVVHVRNNEAKFIRVMEGCLAMFCVTPSEHDIWVMKDYGNSNSWMKCYTFSLKYSKPLYFNSNGEFLYAKDGFGIKSYDVKKNRVRDLAKTYCEKSNYEIYTYVESLVLSSRPVRVTKNWYVNFFCSKTMLLASNRFSI